jgi:hypothetical protein
MLSRRAFAGFASCAICGITEFVATEVFAQGAQPTATGSLRERFYRKQTVRCPAI